MSEKINKQIEDIEDSIDDGYEYDREDIVSKIEQYIEYDVGFDNLKENILRDVAGQNGVSINELQGESDSTGSAGLVDVGDIEEADQFVTLEVKVTDEWDNENDSISQTGLVADNTSKIKFTSWAKSEVPLLNEGDSYRLENVVTDEYNGWMNIKLNSATEVTLLDEDESVDVSEPSGENESLSGLVVDITDDCGLIERCSEDNCSRLLDGGECSEHGDVDGEFDLRIKAVVDNGKDVKTVLINRDLAEELTGTTLSEAQEMAQAELDRTVVRNEFKTEIMLKYVDVDYYEYKGSTIADDVQFSNKGE